MRSAHLAALSGVFVVLATACAPQPKPPADVIAIAPGLRQRLAWMDRFRLHDEGRVRMTARPRVWVEEVEEEEPAAPEEEAESGGHSPP